MSKKPKMLKHATIEGLLEYWKIEYLNWAVTLKQDDFEKGVCVGLLMVLGHDNYNATEIVSKWAKDAREEIRKSALKPAPVQAVCYSAQDVLAEVSGINGWPVNEHGEPYLDMTLALEELPF